MSRPPPSRSISPNQASATQIWRVRGAELLVVLVLAAAYSNSLRGEFVFDDIGAIVENTTIKSFWPITTVLSPPREGQTVEGRPVLNLSLAVNYALHGIEVFGYHFFNLLIHGAASLALFGVVRRTLLLPRHDQALQARSTFLALAVAVLWAAHPLQTESVTYIVQRAESLMGLFYLLTLYCAIRAAEPSTSQLRWHAAAIVACFLGMGTKEVMVSAPLCVVLYDRVFLYDSFGAAWRQRRWFYGGLFASWILLAALVVPSLSRGGTAGFDQEITPKDYALTQFPVVVRYVKLAFWPHPLVFDYGVDVAQPAEIVPYALLIAALALGTLLAFGRWPWIGFLGVCFFAALAPSSSVVPIVTQTAAEHRMYLSLAPLIALVVISLHLAWQYVGSRFAVSTARARLLASYVPPCVLAIVVVGLAARTFVRNQDYRTQWALWNSTLKHRPHNPRLHLSIAERYLEEGQEQAALKAVDRAIALKPDLADAYDSRGTIWQKLQEWDRALADHSRAIELNPDAISYNNRALVYRRLGKLELALEDLNRGLTLAPHSARLLYQRGSLWRALDQPHKAIADFSRVLELEPSAIAYNDRGATWQELGRLEEAVGDYSQAIAMGPDNFIAYSNRGAIYQSLGRFHEALTDFNHALRLAPGDAESYYQRAHCFYSLRNYDEAWSDLMSFRQLGGEPDPEFVKQLSAAMGHEEKSAR